MRNMKREKYLPIFQDGQQSQSPVSRGKKTLEAGDHQWLSGTSPE
jgi:hypothetical protein